MSYLQFTFIVPYFRREGRKHLKNNEKDDTRLHKAPR
jgi:hypothetical protein